MSRQFLSDEQIDSFLTRGHLVLRECFAREAAQEWLDEAWVRMGYDRDDPSTWTRKRIHMPALESREVREFAPDAWRAICELLGGEERIALPCQWGNSFIANLGIGADRPWQAPSPQVTGWHKDGDFFRHFLDSPEQGLLTFVIWSDIEPRGGGTFVACDSVPVVARFLAEHPEGVLPNQFDFQNLVAHCNDFVEMTGRLGDVVLLHPYVLHAVSQNHLGVPRFITNPPISLREPLNFHRDNPDEFSLVERAVLHGLGVEHLNFQPAAPREAIVPERVRHQEQMRQEEQNRLTAQAT